jgi:high-affinity iron transporter
MDTAVRPSRRWAVRAIALLALAAALLALGGSSPASATPVSGTTTVAASATCTRGSLSQSEAVDQLHQVRASIDRTLRLLDAGQRKAAFSEARNGYLTCFEGIEAPLDVVAGVNFRFSVEDGFARVRGLIDTNASTGEVRDRIVTLRGLIDEAERHLTATGFGAPALMFGQSFTLLLREGLEAVLLLSVLLTYLESSEHKRQRKPILIGVGAAVVATVLTYFAVDALFSVLPFGRDVLEAIVGLLAVAMLFYVSFWLIARLDQRRRMEFLQARVWKAASVGSAASLAVVGFTAVYREGFETVLFYQALFSFGRGLQTWVVLGMVAAAVVLCGVAWAVLKMGRTLPVKRFLTIAVVIVMISSVAVLGNAMRALQESAVIDLHVLKGWPDLPIFLAQSTGYFPTLPSVLAQGALIVVYIVGAIITFGFASRRKAAAAQRPDATTSSAPAGQTTSKPSSAGTAAVSH